jgi:hypothetical protein
MKKNERAAKKLKKLRISRETLHTLTSSDTQKVVGGDDTDICHVGTSPDRSCPTE